MIEVLLTKARANINITDKNRSTALHVATVYRNAAAVITMLCHADLNVSDMNSKLQTPMSIASLAGDAFLTSVFLACGAPLEGEGSNLMLQVIGKKLTHIIGLFIVAGAKVETDHLRYAVEVSSPEVMSLLFLASNYLRESSLLEKANQANKVNEYEVALTPSMLQQSQEIINAAHRTLNWAAELMINERTFLPVLLSLSKLFKIKVFASF